MRRSSLFLTLMIALLLSFGLANAQLGNIYISSVSGDYGGGAEDTLRTGTAIVWTINLANGTGAAVTASNNGFRVFSPDGATWNSIDSTNLLEVGGVFTSAYQANVFYYSAPTNTGSGALGDTIGIGGYDGRAVPVGIPVGFNGPALTITIPLPGLSDASDTRRLCITESGYAGEAIWLWATTTGSDAPIWGPPGSPYGGPVCYTVYKVPNECPAFVGAPSSLSFNHCAAASHDFNATDPEGDAITYSKVSGPGTVNGTSGMWNYAPSIVDVGTSQTLVVGATDGLCGGTTQISVPLTFTNVTPTFASGCNTLATAANIGKNNPISVALTATSGDCDPTSFSFVSVSPSPVGSYSVTNGPGGTGALTFNTANADGGFTYDFTVQVTDSKGSSTCHVFINVLIVEPYQVQIEKSHGTTQGGHKLICVTLNAGSEDMWGFDFLIAYDNSALSFVGAIAGDIYAECGWEYFTYRYGASGNCGNACPKGLLRVIGLAETNNGANHPRCHLPAQMPAELFCLDFLVTNDRTFECQYAPVRFYWNDCGDNAISYNRSDALTREEQTLAVSRDIYEHDHEIDGSGIENGTTGFPTYTGAQDECLVGDKDAPIRFIDFINGGVDIVCADSIDDRGDVNLNGLSNEIADAVLFSNYFVYGPGVFTVNLAGQIAATDINVDGLVLSVADLVYLIRIVVGDAQPYPKLAPVESVLKINAKGILNIENVQVGAASIILDGNVEPTLLANNMKLEYAYDNANNVTRALIYSMEAGRSFTGEFLNINGANLVGVEMATYEGAPILAKEVELPTEFALNQNYPNPFNPKTVISFALPTASDYTLTIYNVTGQKVTEYAASAPAGIVTIDVDASTYSSGVYFYKLIADNGRFTETKKMVLVK